MREYIFTILWLLLPSLQRRCATGIHKGVTGSSKSARKRIYFVSVSAATATNHVSLDAKISACIVMIFEFFP